ncbi:MAG: hypothetical protein P1U86_05070 [Verrucomicrobiales bacterium]|nr:hypothetical protein [Verrucomicrobiales bacterium]
MSFLFLFKRFEIWLLLAVVVGLFFVAFSPEEVETEVTERTEILVLLEKKLEVELPGNKGPETVEPEEEPAFAVKEIKVRPDGGGKVVEVTLSGRAHNGEETPVNDDTLKAMTAAGEPVSPFFEPFRETLTFYPDEASLITTRWWLEKPTDAIWLEFQGQRVEAVLP